MSDKTLAEIHDDLLAYLNDDECVDPIGYLETVQLELQTAIAVLDTAELARGAAPTSPSEPVPSTPRVWAAQTFPEDVVAFRDAEGHIWCRDVDRQQWRRDTNAWTQRDPLELLRYHPRLSPLTEVEETNDAD